MAVVVLYDGGSVCGRSGSWTVTLIGFYILVMILGEFLEGFFERAV